MKQNAPRNRQSFPIQGGIEQKGRRASSSLAPPSNVPKAKANKKPSPVFIAGICLILLIAFLILLTKAPLVAGFVAIFVIGGLCWTWWKKTTDRSGQTLPTRMLALPAPASLLLPKQEDKRDQALAPGPGKEASEEAPLRLFEEQSYLLPPALLRSANTLVIEDPQDEPKRASAFLVFFEELTRKSRRPVCVWTTQTAHLALGEGNEDCLLVGHPRAGKFLSPETRSRFVPLATPQQAKIWSNEFLNRKQHALVLLSTYPDEESAAQILTTTLGAIEEIIRGEPARSALMIIHQANRFLPKDGDQGLDLFMNETLAREIRSFLLNLLLDGPTIGLPFCLFADEVTCMERQALESCRIWMVNKVPWFDTSNAQNRGGDEVSLVASCLRLSSGDLSPLGQRMALLADRGVPPEKIKWKSFRPLPSPWSGDLVSFNWPQIEWPIDSVGVAGEADATHFALGQGDTLSDRYKAYMCVLLRYYPGRATVSQIVNPSPDWLRFLEEIGIDPDNPLPIMEVQTLLVTVRKRWDNNEDEIARTLYQKYSHLVPPLHQARSAPQPVSGKKGSPPWGDTSANHLPPHQPPFSGGHQDMGVAGEAGNAISTRQVHFQTEEKPPTGSGTEVSQKALPFGDIPRMEDLPSNTHRQGGQMPGRQDLPFSTSSWILPPLGLLASPQRTKAQTFDGETAGLAQTIAQTLYSFRVDAEVREEDISIGPTVIRFGIRPTGKPEFIKDEKTAKMVPVRDAQGNILYEVRTRISRIMALQNDLALVLEAKTIRMEAPVPGRPYVGVEIPNKNSRLVTLCEVLESKEYQEARAKSKLAIGLGRDVAGEVRVSDLARMPHLLIAGATGAGKCLAHDEPVFLADGRIVKVQELLGQTVEVIGVKDTETMHQTPVLATFTDNGTQEVFEIELDNGIILRRTGEHPLWAACLDENQHVGRQANGKATRRTRAIGADWVQVKDLRVCGNRPDFDGHVILCPLSLKQHGTVSRSDADVVLCAALLAEGSLNSYEYLNYNRTPRFTSADPLMVELVEMAAKAYDCKLVGSATKGKATDYYITRNIVKKWEGNPISKLVCDWKINCLATQKVIPEWVFHLPNEQIALFLRVFTDCDGWVSVRGHRSSVSVSLANPVLVQQIGQLAMRLGITGTHTKKENGFAGAWTWSTTMVTEWQERVGSLIKSEKLALAVTDQKNSREWAATVWNAWRRAHPQTGQRFSDCPQGYEWRKIVAIRHTIAPTVNIEVHSDNHAFVGYAVEHNSVCVNAIIASILTQATPDDVRLLMVDPKMVELNMYNGIPHLLSPVVTEVEKVVPLLKNAMNEMERRYRLFSKLSVRNLDGYRKLRLEKLTKGDTELPNLPAIVIIIDELADLMMAAPEEVEGMICRLAQLARATGIHLVVATQRPSVDVITGLIKANIPTRISFMVSSAVDSRTIIDMGGAERLLGRGDMLYLPADAGRPERIQGSFLTDEETEKLVAYWRQQVEEWKRKLALAQPAAQEEQHTPLPEVVPGWEIIEQLRDDLELDDELLSKAEEVVRQSGRASISLLQRRLRVGYSRAARLIDQLEEHGVIGQPIPGGRTREVYPLEEEEKEEIIHPETQVQPEEAESLPQETSLSSLAEILPISRGDLGAEQELSQGNPGEEDRPLASQEKPNPPRASFLLEDLSIYWLLLEMRNHKGAGSIPTPRDQRNAPKHEMHLGVAAHILWSGAVSTDNIRDFLPISKDTIKRILGELVAMGMLVEGGRGRHLRRDIHLAQLSPELHALWDFFLEAPAPVKRNNSPDELLEEAQATEASGACSLRG